MFLFLILLLQFTVTVQNLTSFTATVGISITLPCKNLTDDQCNSVTWLFSHSGNTTVLFEDGKIKAKSDQLYVTPDCSLNVKEVRFEDAGRYTCRQFRSGQQHGNDTAYDLSVVNSKDTKTTTVKPKTTPIVETQTQRKRTSKTMKPTTTTPKSKTTGTNTSASAVNGPPTKQGLLLRFIIVSVGLAVLIIIVVAVNMWSRTKEKKTQMDEITVRYDEGDGTVNYEKIRASDEV